MVSESFMKSRTNVSCFGGRARLSRDSVWTALMPDSTLSTYIVMQQRLVVAGLKLVGHDQEPIRVLFEDVGNLVAGKAIKRRFGHLLAGGFVLAGKGDNRFVRTLALHQV